MSNYCYTCMNEIPEGNYCPHCQKENTADNIVYRLKPGTVLNNKYVVGNCLGEGGFGITYIGRDLMLDIRVAIKEFYPNGYVNRNNTVDQNVTATTESQKNIFNKGKERFLEEARKVAKFLGEPGIVGVREYFELNGTAYIIMEYLDGQNLAAYIKRNGTFKARDIFKLMLPVTHSLKRVHDSGMIHRDISPDNIMYMKNGTLKLMDFGSARYFTNEKKEMSVLLKQGYAPEEQYRKNGKQGPWTDVYGLCATIYRCITGTIPEDALDRLRSDGLVPPSQLGFDIPEAFENILLYGLAVFRENRCQNMEELSALIEMALEDPQKAAVETRKLVPGRGAAQAQSHTVMADEGDLNTAPARPLTGNPAAARPVNAKPASARPVNAKPASAQPVNAKPAVKAPSASPAPAKTAVGVQTATAPPKKKKKTGLIIGLISGVVVVAIVLGLIFFVFGGSSLDGKYRLTAMVANGSDLSSSLNGLIIEMNVDDNHGTLTVGETSLSMDFDPGSKKVVVRSGTNSDEYSYRVEGKMLTVEDGGTNSMTFMKQ